MISQTDPESMTAEERRREVAAILANGLLRRLRAAESTRRLTGRVSETLTKGAACND